MALVDPFIIPLPRKLAADPEVGPYFTYLSKFLHDMWKRTGGGSDLVGAAVTDADLASAIATHTASNNNTTQAELDAAFTAHVAAGNPHPVYTTDAEVAALIAAHTASADNATDAEVAAAISALNLASGVYTPTLTSVANVNASTAYQCQYLRVGSVVNVSGVVDVDPAVDATETQLGISLPIASNFADHFDCNGAAHSLTAQRGAGIYADTANNRAELRFLSNDTDNRAMHFVFQFRII